MAKKKQELKGQLLDAQLASPQTSPTRSKRRQLELLITEEELQVWNLLADGKTGVEVAKELDIAPATVTNRINKALEKIRGWAGRTAEDWRNQQLLIVNKQISAIIDDTNTQVKPLTDINGKQMFNRNGTALWEISPTQALKARNMARNTLKEYLKHQADLLDLTVERKEISVDQRVAIAVYDLGDFEGAASLDDL